VRKLLLLILAATFGVSVGFSQTFTDGWTYTLNGNNEATITSYSGPGGAVAIPASVGGFPVKTVGGGRTAIFGSGNTSVTSVTIPDSVTRIGDYAFDNCIGLTSVIIPNSVTSIGEGALSLCSGLTGITIPNSVTSIGVAAFAGCTGLTRLTIPDSVTSIVDRVFAGCSGLISITIGNGATSIGDAAFESCTSLASLTIGSGVTSILDVNPWADCISLTSFHVAVENLFFSSIEGVLFNKDATTLIGFPPGRSGSYIIPLSATAVGSAAFSNCRNLTSVIVPNSVTSVGDHAFSNCISLTSIYFLGNHPSEGVNIVSGIVQTGTVYYVAGATGWTSTFAGWPTHELPIGPLLTSFGESQFNEGQSSVASNPSAFNLFTQAQYEGNYNHGVSAGVDGVVSDPAAYNLFTQAQYEANRATGVSDGKAEVTNSPSSYGLFTEAQFSANRVNGRADVTQRPNSYGLYTKAQYDSFGASRFGSGQTSVRSNPSAFKLVALTNVPGIRVATRIGNTFTVSMPGGWTRYAQSGMPKGWSFNTKSGLLRGTMPRRSRPSVRLTPYKGSVVGAPITIEFRPTAK
jgi:hypothetical protein